MTNSFLNMTKYGHKLPIMTKISSAKKLDFWCQKRWRPVFHANVPPKWWNTHLFCAFTTFEKVLSKFGKMANSGPFLRCSKNFKTRCATIWSENSKSFWYVKQHSTPYDILTLVYFGTPLSTWQTFLHITDCDKY